MHRFEVIEGARSLNYNTFKDYTFESCIATNTRLMGVVALKITLLKNDDSGHIMNIIMHLDFSEYGVDEYMEFFHDSYAAAREDHQYNDFWNEVAGSLGGSFVEIPLGVLLNLIDSALKINRAYFSKHDVDIREFRKDMLVKVEQLHAAYDPVASASSYSSDECIGRVSPETLSAYETINYFVMRMVDLDFVAASYLSDLDIQSLSDSQLASHGISSLIKNSLYSEADSDECHCSYLCNALTQNESQYFFSELNIKLTKIDSRWQIASFNVLSSQRISPFEAALQTKQEEYIVVYNTPSTELILDKFATLEMMLNYTCNKVEVPCGTMYAKYKKNNSHVDTDNYFINHDLYGAYLVTSMGELILMSNSIYRIELMQHDIANALVFTNTEITGSYRFESQVFQTFIMTQDTLFADILTDPDE